MKRVVLSLMLCIVPQLLFAAKSYVVARKVIFCENLNEIAKLASERPNETWYARLEQDLFIDHNSDIPRAVGQPPMAHNKLRTQDYTAAGDLKRDDGTLDPRSHSRVLFVQEIRAPEQAADLEAAGKLEEVTVCREYYLVSERP